MPGTNDEIKNTSPIIEEPQIEFAHVRSFFTNIIKDIWDLRKGVDKKAAIAEINMKKSLSGANAWMLMCSIMIASIGLDRNSPAVIIGAMLISPLMAPILGIGLGVGINDRRVLKTSLLHFSVAILIAILVSTLYFIITPLGIYESEIQARTEPTALDILIAFFGGIAGIISIARKDISTTIPGVAIATALMPPLCVTGYGIANWDTNIILNSFYLFFSNTFFICLATYLIVRFLKFPFKKYPNKKEKRRNVIYVSIFSLLVIIPSLLILNKVIKTVDVERTIEKMLVAEFGTDKRYLDDYKLITEDSTNILILKVYGNANNSDIELRCQNKLDSLGLGNLDVKVLFTSEVNLNQFDNLRKQISSASKDKRFKDSLETLQNQNTVMVKTLRAELKKNLIDTTEFNAISRTTKLKFPELERIAIGNMSMRDFESASNDNLTAAVVEWREDVSAEDLEYLEISLKAYLEGYLRKENIAILKK
jgi:uncharacterized hydrophobic protein (TIGR00271 family)